VSFLHRNKKTHTDTHRHILTHAVYTDTLGRIYVFYIGFLIAGTHRHTQTHTDTHRRIRTHTVTQIYSDAFIIM